MEKTFKFNSELVYTAQIDIENILNTTIEAIDNHGNYYYLIINTSMGKSEILEFGPIIDDIDLSNNFTLTYSTCTASPSTATKVITKFLAPRKNLRSTIIEAMPVMWEDIIDKCPDIVSYVTKNFIKSDSEEEE